jgi:hypothetical protein
MFGKILAGIIMGIVVAILATLVFGVGSGGGESGGKAGLWAAIIGFVLMIVLAVTAARGRYAWGRGAPAQRTALLRDAAGDSNLHGHFRGKGIWICGHKS